MNETLRFILAAVFITAGLLFCGLGVFGVFRFRFVLNRMHAAAVIDTLGMLLLSVGLMIAAPGWSYVWKLAAVVAVLWIGGPLSTHLVGRMELDTDGKAKDYMKEEDRT